MIAPFKNLDPFSVNPSNGGYLFEDVHRDIVEWDWASVILDVYRSALAVCLSRWGRFKIPCIIPFNSSDLSSNFFAKHNVSLTIQREIKEVHMAGEMGKRQTRS
jgi:hypothetical protein